MPFLILIPFKIDFDFKTIIYRFKAVFNIFSENKKLNISNWILFDTPNNTIFGPHLKKCQDTFRKNKDQFRNYLSNKNF